MAVITLGMKRASHVFSVDSTAALQEKQYTDLLCFIVGICGYQNTDLLCFIVGIYGYQNNRIYIVYPLSNHVQPRFKTTNHEFHWQGNL